MFYPLLMKITLVLHDKTVSPLLGLKKKTAVSFFIDILFTIFS